MQCVYVRVHFLPVFGVHAAVELGTAVMQQTMRGCSTEQKEAAKTAHHQRSRKPHLVA